MWSPRIAYMCVIFLVDAVNMDIASAPQPPPRRQNPFNRPAPPPPAHARNASNPPKSFDIHGKLTITHFIIFVDNLLMSIMWRRLCLSV